MATSKVITYTDSSGALLTATVTIDVQKLAVGENDEEQVFLVLSAPGIASNLYWRRNIEGLVEDGIFAGPSGTDHETRYAAQSDPSGAYGDKITNEGTIAGVSGIAGIRTQLIALAG